MDLLQKPKQNLTCSRRKMLALGVAFMAVSSVAEAAECEVTPMVDRHMLRPAMDASLRPSLSWTLSPG